MGHLRPGGSCEEATFSGGDAETRGGGRDPAGGGAGGRDGASVAEGGGQPARAAVPSSERPRRASPPLRGAAPGSKGHRLTLGNSGQGAGLHHALGPAGQPLLSRVSGWEPGAPAGAMSPPGGPAVGAHTAGPGPRALRRGHSRLHWGSASPRWAQEAPEAREEAPLRRRVRSPARRGLLPLCPAGRSPLSEPQPPVGAATPSRRRRHLQGPGLRPPRGSRPGPGPRAPLCAVGSPGAASTTGPGAGAGECAAAAPSPRAKPNSGKVKLAETLAFKTARRPGLTSSASPLQAAGSRRAQRPPHPGALSGLPRR